MGTLCRMHIQLSALLMLVVIGCSAGPTPAPTQDAAHVDASPISTSAAPTRAGPLAPGEEVREGVLERLKHHPTLGGSLLVDRMKGRMLPPDWQTSVVGKRVRVRGVPRPAIHCPPDADCALPSDIPIFEVTTLEILDR